MIDRDFERLLEGLDNEIADLPDGSTKENLTNISSALYSIFEDLDFEEPDELKKENTVMRKLLADRLSHEEKQYIRFKYHIDIDEGVTGHEWVI